MRKACVLCVFCIHSFLHALPVFRPCCADSDWKGSLNVSTGYRQDTVDVRFIFPDQSGHETFQWPDMSIYSIGGDFYLSYKNFCLRAAGDWGKICGGTKSVTHTDQVIPNFPLPGITTTTASDTSGTPGGYVYDVSGGAGFSFFTPCHRFMFAPLLGYSLHEQVMKEDDLAGQTTEENALLSIVNSDRETRTVTTRWNGFLAGADLACNINCHWALAGMYAFHWGKLHLLGTADLQLTQVTPPANPAPTTTASVIRKVHRTAYGQNAGLGISYTFCTLPIQPHLGLSGYYTLWNAKKNGRVDKTDMINREGSVVTIQGEGLATKVRWQSWSVLCDFGFNF